ncbi:MAG: DUF4124 domain-containing protein [Woeseiaceae bacterium]
MFKRSVIALGALLAAGAVLAQAYRWVDENGVVHYSDKPVPGAEEYQLPSYRRPSGPAVPASRSTRSSAAASQPVSQPFRYESLTVAAPGPEETLWNIAGVLSVTLNLQPALQSGHRLRVYFDGTPQMVDGTSFQLQEVWRGVHNIQAEVIDQAGQLMIRSQPTRFYVQQNAIGG